MQPEQDVNESGIPIPELPSLTRVLLEPEREPFWGYLDLLLFLGLMAASALFLLLLIGGLAHVQPSLMRDPAPVELSLNFALYACAYLCFLVIFKLKYDRGVWESLGWRKSSYSLLTAGFGGVLLAFAIVIVAPFVHTPKVGPFEDLAKTPLSMALLAVTAVFVAPLFEETVFRGFLQPLFSRTLGVVFGILLTALLFGGLHTFQYKFAWQYVVAITIVGTALGALRAKTNSIIPGTVMHGCFNAVSVVGLVAAKYLPHK